jgi:hypothetical protein
LIGQADLQVGDKSMGFVYGVLVPNEYYYKNIQKHVWEFCLAGKPDFDKWHALNFNAQLENGWFLCPAGGYAISDLPDLPDEPKQIDIAGISQDVIEGYFNSDPSTPFVEEPWAAINIEQKLYFEEELQKEIDRPSNSVLNLITKKHVLAGYFCAAVCNSIQEDDVLFSIYSPIKGDQKFALVHLTFSGKPEESHLWPYTTLYKSFNDFKFLRMYPDKADWED